MTVHYREHILHPSCSQTPDTRKISLTLSIINGFTSQICCVFICLFVRPKEREREVENVSLRKSCNMQWIWKPQTWKTRLSKMLSPSKCLPGCWFSINSIIWNAIQSKPVDWISLPILFGLNIESRLTIKTLDMSNIVCIQFVAAINLHKFEYCLFNTTFDWRQEFVCPLCATWLSNCN